MLNKRKIITIYLRIDIMLNKRKIITIYLRIDIGTYLGYGVVLFGICLINRRATGLGIFP